MSSPPPARRGDSTFSTQPVGLPEGQTDRGTDGHRGAQPCAGLH